MAQDPSFQVVDEPNLATTRDAECTPVREKRGQLILDGQAGPRGSVPAKLANVPVGAIPREDTASQLLLDLICGAILDCLLHFDDGGTAIQQGFEQGLGGIGNLGLAGVQR